MGVTLPDLPQTEAAIIEMTNAFRREHKLAPVAVNAQLTTAARAYARFLASRDLFSHTADGRQPAARAAEAGYRYCEIAENLALNQDSRGLETRELATKAMSGWINSPGHRANLESPGATEIGVAVARSGDAVPKYVSVQVFGRPRTLEIEFQVSNSSTSDVTYTFGGETHELTPRLAITHQSCRGGPLVFTVGGGFFFSKARTIGQYEAADGQLYVVKTDANDALKIEVRPREKPPAIDKSASSGGESAPPRARARAKASASKP